MDNINSILAASVRLDIDYSQMTVELLRCMNHARSVQFSYVNDDSTPCVAHSLFLRESAGLTEYSFRGVKSASMDSWSWDESIDIPYTKSVIDNLPFKPLGPVRVVYFPDIPCMTHTDWDDPLDTKHTLGLSIIPSTGKTHCNVWSEKLQRDVSIHGHAMLLNDSVPHWVPKATGTRITMRVFGEIDYDWFSDKIDYDNCYLL
jgi:hypothetical protein